MTKLSNVGSMKRYCARDTDDLAHQVDVEEGELLEVVLVHPLRVHEVLVFVRCHGGVLDAVLLAERPDAHHVPEVHEEGSGDDEADVAELGGEGDRSHVDRGWRRVVLLLV